MKKTISLLFALCTLAIAVIPVNAVERHRSIELMRYSNISDVWAGYSEANLIGTCSGCGKRGRNTETLHGGLSEGARQGRYR